MKRILLAGALALTTTLGQAALIGNYSLSGNIVTDSANNLEWLRWDQTVGLSINDALAANSGWQLASLDQMINLFNDFELQDPTDTSLSGFQFTTTNVLGGTALVSTGASEASEDPAEHDKKFISLFGNIYNGHLGPLVQPASVEDSRAVFGDILNGDFFIAGVQDDYLSVGVGENAPPNAGIAALLPLDASFSAISEDTINGVSRGVALVRSTTTTPPAPMPEPSILMLFAGGLLGLGLIRRRQKKH